MLVTERAGRLRTVTAGRLGPGPVGGVPPVRASGQGGLLDVALHPDFRKNGWVYLSYAAGSWGRAGTEVARGRLRGNRLEDVEVLFRALPKSSGGRHFGSRLRFAPDGHLFISLGDRGDRHRAQDPGDHAGSIIRLLDDGRVPPDNPFAGVDGARPEVFTPGNPQRAGPRLRSEYRRPLVARARAPGRRRAERGAPRSQLRLAGHPLSRMDGNVEKTSALPLGPAPFQKAGIGRAQSGAFQGSPVMAG